VPHDRQGRAQVFKGALQSVCRKAAMTPEDYVKRLESVVASSASDRLDLLASEEHNYFVAARDALKGLGALADAFNSLFLETVERLNSESRPKVKQQLSDHYPLFVPRLVTAFRVLRAAENTAFDGYPLQGYTLLRNVFDDNVLTAAALQQITTFYAIEGVDPKAKVDPKTPIDASAILGARRRTEFAVTRVMVGADSGLSAVAREDLAKLNRLFDFETHGARLSLTHAMNWMQGRGGLEVTPKFDENGFAIFANRYCEIAWMTHRLLPQIQPPDAMFAGDWGDKWAILDDSFKMIVESLSTSLGKTVGSSFVEFIETKFPFNQARAFPL
jgi:hypothetical protein